MTTQAIDNTALDNEQILEIQNLMEKLELRAQHESIEGFSKKLL